MWTIEHTPLGRIVIPPHVPNGFALFCTSIDYPGRVIADELTSVVRERFGLQTSLNTCLQTHGATVKRATRQDEWRECDSCDALWADEAGIALGIKVADCLPVTMIDPAHRVIADVHSGWRGAIQRITSATLDALGRGTAFDPQSASAYLGPSIRVCCFEVGEEVAERFDERYVDRRRTKPHVDVPVFTFDLLRQHGIAAERIFDSQLCTRCEGSMFHSYRREGKGGGRNLAIVAQ